MIKKNYRNTIFLFKRVGKKRGRLALGYRKKKFIQWKKKKIFFYYKRIRYIRNKKYKKKIYILKRFLFKVAKFSFKYLKKIFRKYRNDNYLGRIQKFFYLFKYRLFIYIIFLNLIKLKWKFFFGSYKQKIDLSIFYIKQGNF